MTSSIAPSVSQAWGSFGSTVSRPASPADAAPVDAPSGIVQPIAQVAGLTMETFESWTPTSQSLYLRLHGPQRLSSASDSYILTLSADGLPFKRVLPIVSGDGARPPSGTVALVAEPDKLSIADFHSWPTTSQAAYIKAANGSTGGAIELQGTDGRFQRFQEDQYGHVKSRATSRVAGFGMQPTLGQTVNLGSEKSSNGANAPQGVELGDKGWRPNPSDTLTDIPYYHLPGSSAGNNGALVKAGADALFPALDGAAADRTLPEDERPEGFEKLAASLDTPEKAEAFMKQYATWHSAYQTEWIRLNTPATSSETVPAGSSTGDKTIVTAGIIEIPPLKRDIQSDKITQFPIVSLFVSTGDAGNTDPYRRTFRPINIATISKEQIGMLNAADQTRVATSIQFLSIRQLDLGLIGLTLEKPDGWKTGDAMTADGAGAAVYNKIQTLIGTVTGSLRKSVLNETPVFDDSTVFVDQLKLLRTQIDGSITGANGAAFVDKAKIDAQLTEIEKRYKRAKSYYDSGYGALKENTKNVRYDGDSDHTTTIPTLVVSLDDGALIRSGYDTFITQEKRLLQYAKNRYEVASGTVPAEFQGKPFDAPTLIYYLQNKYNQSLEATVTIETEAVKQLNAYLKDYAEFQDWVQQTLGSFTNDQIKDGGAALGLAYGGATDDETKRRKLFKEYREKTADEKGKRLFKLALMFEDSNNQVLEGSGSHGYPKHPAEVEKNITRPDGFDIFLSGSGSDKNYQLAHHTYQEWQTYSTRLGDKVTQLNQDSQQKMNDINNMDKQRNRHYDLANSALSKMNDALQSILRATG